MGSEHKSGFYAVIPAPVMNDRLLTDGAKMLYATISQLVNEEGYCFASNQYFADRHAASLRTIQRALGMLARRGYIRLDICREAAREQEVQRKIYIVEGMTQMSPRHDKNDVPGHDKNDTHKSISININNKTFESNVPSCFDFESFWSVYDLKTGKAKCEAAYRRILEADREKIKAALPRYVAATFTDSRFPSRKYPLTWLRGRCWEDEGPSSTPAPGGGLTLFNDDATRRKEMEAFE